MKPNKSNPFKVPSNYFEELEASLLKKQIAKSQSPFRVPPLYFETLEEKITQNVNKRTVKEEYASLYTMAAIFLVLVMGFFWTQTDSEEAIANDAIEWVVLEEMNTYEMATFIETDLSYVNFSTEGVNFDFIDYALDLNETNTYENSSN